MRDKILKLSVVASMATPFLAFAQIPDISIDDAIPSAKSNFTFSGLLTVGNNTIGLIVSVIVALSVLSIIFGGYSFVTAGGDEGKVEAARNRIIYGVIGIAIIILAISIFSIVGSFL